MNNNKNILIVVPNIPRFDIASGDLRLYTMVKLLCDDYNVVVFDTESWGKSDDRYFEEMNKLGATVYGRETGFKKVLEKYNFTVAILEFYHVADYYTPRIRMMQKDCFIIVDSVDVHFLREELKYNITRDKADLDKSIATKEKEMHVYSQADCVITVTKEDGESINKENGSIPIEVIPNIHNTIDLAREHLNKNNLLFVGSFGHEPNVDAMEYFCSAVMPLLNKELPDMKLSVVGTNPPDNIKKYAGNNIKFLGFVPSVTPYLEKAYISIAPLRFGAGMKGKIGEAMAHGVPVITTSIGNQGLNLTHRENVMLAESPQNYVECIKELVHNDALYYQIAQNALDYIENNYSEKVIQRKIYSIINALDNKKIKQFNWLKKIEFIVYSILNRLKLVRQ